MKEKEFFDKKSIWLLLLLIVTAYLFSIGMRAYWPLYFSDNSSMYYNGQLMINTNDGYFFASGARDILSGIFPENLPRISAFNNSLSKITAFATQLLPFSLETITLYLSSFVASLVVIPIVLTGRLMGHTFLGFLAALIGSIAWSYYNRTMVGYYDSDMFAILLQFTIFYSFMYIAYSKNLKAVILAAILLFTYPYFYPQGLTITYAMYFMLMAYMIAEYFKIITVNETDSFKKEDTSLYTIIILLAIPMMKTLPIDLRAILFLIAIVVLTRVKPKEKQLIYASLVFFVAFLFFGNVLDVLTGKLMLYLNRGTEIEGLHFYQVIQTVREAGSIPMTTVANRISGSSIGLALSLIGYTVLVWRHKPLIVALPLVGVGLFAYIGGLRFTVYAVPIMAISVVYLFWFIGSFFKEKLAQYTFVILATGAMLYPNIIHIIGYKVPTVMNRAEVGDLAKLNKISSRKDYTLSWWDYGYPIWYYSDTSTLIDGGKHEHDNFIISKIMQTPSQNLAANLSRLAVETYVSSNYSIVADTLFKNKQKDQINPDLLLSELEDSGYKPPKKTRDIYLYLPYRMMRIFPTVAVFGNLDLLTGKPKRKIAFSTTTPTHNKEGILTFRNGIIFDSRKGKLRWGAQVNERVKTYLNQIGFDSLLAGEQDIKYFVVAKNTKQASVALQSHHYSVSGKYSVVYLESYGKFVLMDTETFNSAYVQMFMLEKYDKNLFELVVSSPYSKIYKLKI